MSLEMSNESHRHSGFAGPNTELDERDGHNSTCTNFPTSSHFITPAVGAERERPESTFTNCTNFPTSAHFITPAVPVDSGTHESICTKFPNSFGHANPLGGLPQEEISTEDVTQHNCIDASNDLILRSRSQLSKPMRSQKRLPESQMEGGKRLTTSFCADSEPWRLYNKFAELGASGTTYLALGPLNPVTAAELVVVKEQRAADASATKKLTRIRHENIVSLIDAYLSSGKVFFVYERMDVSLTRLNAYCCLKEEHIAAICREVIYSHRWQVQQLRLLQVLNGLKYIHRELKTSISKPLYENTFLNYTGYVKIGANADFSFSFSLG